MDNEEQSRSNGLIDNPNSMHGMMRTNYSDVKWNKQRELNNGMSITQSAENAYQRKMRGIAGGND